MPVWRGCNLVVLVFGFLIQIRVRAPGDASICHKIWLSWSITCGIDQSGRVEGIVKDGVGDQSTRVICLALVVVSQGVARAVVDGVVAKSLTFQLICVERLDISSMVLVEVRETVVEIDWRSNVIRDVE